METSIIAACIQSRKAYEQVLAQQMDREFSPKIGEIFKAINNYYIRDTDANTCDINLIRKQFERLTKKHREIFLTFLDELPQDISVNNILDYIIETKRSKLKDNMREAIERENDNELDKIIETYKTLQIVKSLDEFETYIGIGVQNLLDSNRSENLIKLAPKNLNMKLDGGIPRGESTNILIYAYTEVGKTLFAINLAYIFAKQGLSVCYIGNEDSTSRMRFRFLSRFASNNKEIYSKSKILVNEPKALKRALKRGYNNFRFIPLSPGTLADLIAIVTQYTPDVLIIDQMHKILVPKSRGESDQMTQVSEFVRNLGKKYNIITVNIVQANPKQSIYTREGKPQSRLILGQSDVYMSNVALPGAQDLMIGIGMDESMVYNGHRLLSIPKNKISGWHGQVPIKIFPDINSVISLT